MKFPQALCARVEEELAGKLWDDICQTSWYPALAYNLSLFLVFVVHAWAIALSAIAMHFLREFTWKKAAGISVTAYLIHILVRTFFLMLQ